MKKFKRLFCLLIVLILATGCGKKEKIEIKPEPVSVDAAKFKEEYEALNNTTRESDGASYNNVSIPEDNPIEYVDCQKALEVLASEKAILYVGAPWCPWCRNAVPVLFEVAKKYNVDKIYYLDLDKEKSNYEIQEGKLVQLNKGTEAYYKLLERLDNNLRDYILKDKDGKEYDTKEKRIYMPYVIGIKNKEVVSDHIGTVTLDKEQTKYSELTEKQHDELFTTYENMFKGIFSTNDICTTGNCD